MSGTEHSLLIGILPTSALEDTFIGKSLTTNGRGSKHEHKKSNNFSYRYIFAVVDGKYTKKITRYFAYA